MELTNIKSLYFSNIITFETDRYNVLNFANVLEQLQNVKKTRADLLVFLLLLFIYMHGTARSFQSFFID